jgi:hypothetical protein
MRRTASRLVLCASHEFNATDYLSCNRGRGARAAGPNGTAVAAAWVQLRVLGHATRERHAAVVACPSLSDSPPSPRLAAAAGSDVLLAGLDAASDYVCSGGHLASFWLFEAPPGSRAESGATADVLLDPQESLCTPPQDWSSCALVRGGGSADPAPLRRVEQRLHALTSTPLPRDSGRPSNKTETTSSKPGSTNNNNIGPPGFGVEHIQSVPSLRRAVLSFIEVNAKVEALASAGVGVKEIFAMVVDAIGNMMPEIITQLISSLIKIPLVTLIGQLLAALLPDALVPNSQSTPNVPIVPGIDPIKPAPTPPCKCSGGAGFSLLERWREKKLVENGMGIDNVGLVEEGAARRISRSAVGCDCENTPSSNKNTIMFRSPTPPLFLETQEVEKATDQAADEAEDEVTNRAKELLAAEEKNSLWREQMRQRAPTSAGGANGGPIAKIESKVRDNVMDGLLANCMPELQEKLAAKIIGLWPVVKYSVYRGSVRGLSQSLTSSVTQALVQALLDKVFHGITKYGTRQLVARIVPGLTHSLSATITHALSRSPKDDYYCHYCNLHKLYCDKCMQATVAEYEKDYYISYYSTYFSAYYSAYYSTSIADHFSSGVGKPGHAL